MKLSLYDRYEPAGIEGVAFRLTLKWVLCLSFKGIAHRAVSPKPVTLHRRSLMGNSVFLLRVKEAKGKRGVTACVGRPIALIERLSEWEDVEL